MTLGLLSAYVGGGSLLLPLPDLVRIFKAGRLLVMPRGLLALGVFVCRALLSAAVSARDILRGPNLWVLCQF